MKKLINAAVLTGMLVSTAVYAKNINAKRLENERLTREIAGLCKIKKELNAQLKELSIKKTTLNRDNNNLHVKKEKTTKELEQIKKELALYKEERVKGIDERKALFVRRDRLINKVNNLNENYNVLKEQISAGKSNLEHINADIEKKTFELNKLTVKLTSIKAELDKASTQDFLKTSDYATVTGVTEAKVEQSDGVRGEMNIARILEGMQADQKILYNVYIPTDSHIGSVEIDCIVIKEGGIYLIESKNGTKNTEDDAYARYGGNVFQQIRCHEMAFKSFIRENGVPGAAKCIDSMKTQIVFGDRAGELNLKHANTNDYCRPEELPARLQSAYNMLSKKQVNALYELLKPYQNHPELKKKHDEALNKRYHSKKAS